MVTRAVLALLAVAACQGHGNSSSDVEPGSGGAGNGSAKVRPGGFGGTADATAVEPDEPVDAGSSVDGAKPDEPEIADPVKAVAELGAISAWQTVVDRAQLLARRNQHGVAFGKVGGPVMMLGPTPEPTDAGVHVDAGLVASPYTWLVDDTEGNGCLAIKVDLGARASQVKPGDRVALGGAWMLDADRTWYWKVDAISPLPPAPPILKDPPGPPGHTVVTGEFPPGARMISFARDDDAVIFQLVGYPPVGDGDGWPVADELGNPPFAMLVLPGERASYGAQDMRTSDERWSLKRAQTYWVRIGKLHKRGPDKPMLLYARTAPVRVK